MSEADNASPLECGWEDETPCCSRVGDGGSDGSCVAASGIAKVHSGPFLERLPRYSGYEWQQVGVDLVLVSIASGLIADILYDVFD